jgi:hypothetical protein
MVNLTLGLGRFITISVCPLEIAPIVGVDCIASVCTNQNPVNAMKFRKSTLFKSILLLSRGLIHCCGDNQCVIL